MKKLALTLLSVLSVSLCAAEAIKTVNFNPSRFGKYEKLKVSEKATFKGGLEANAMSVQASNGGAVNMNSNSNYDVPLVRAITAGSTGLVGIINFPSTCFYGNAAGNNCVISPSAFNSNLELAMTGGKVAFVQPGVESRIQTVLANPRVVNLRGSTLQMLNTRLRVTATSTGADKFDYTGAALDGIRLAGIVIPPADRFFSGLKTLKWEPRRTVMDESQGNSTEYQVLVAL